MGFGLGFDVVEDLGRNGRYGSPGAFGWGGAYHTNYWADAKEKLVALVMVQLLPVGLSEALRRCVDEWASSKSSPRTPEPQARPLTRKERESFDQVFAAFGLKPRRRRRPRR